jgi:hypothetical protein
MPCRGSGQVISNLGGTPTKVTCPWCAGSGVRDPHADAQAAWRSEDAERPSDGGTDSATAQDAPDGG